MNRLIAVFAWVPALVLAAEGGNSWAVLLVAVLVPIGPIVVSHLLTRKKLQHQDTKVQEIHVLVNSRLSKTLDALSAALTENIRLKEDAGIRVTEEERKAAVRTEDGIGGGHPEL